MISRTSGMRRATAATHSGASTSISRPGSFSCSRARSGCAISASPIQFGATTRIRGKTLMTLDGCALVDEPGAAVRAERFAFLHHVEEHARMARPQRRVGQRAVQRQILFADFDRARGIAAAHRLPFFSATGMSQWRVLFVFPGTTAEQGFLVTFVTGPPPPPP